MLWPLILGFALSSVVQALVSHRAHSRLLGDDSPRSLSLAALSGIASSSCSYAAVALAREHAERNAVGRMEGHAAMEMSVEGGGFFARLLSGRGFTAVSHLFVMDWASVWVDVLGGFLIAGALAGYLVELVFGALGLIPPTARSPLLATIPAPTTPPR